MGKVSLLIPLITTLTSSVFTCTLAAQVVSQYPPAIGEVLNWRIYGGRVEAISVDPKNASNIMVSAQRGGLWRTVDGGNAWRHVDALNTVGSRDVGYGPQGTRIIATVSRDTRLPSGGGIWLSRDNGDSWIKPATSTLGDRMAAYGISWRSADTVYVGTDYGVAISYDAGETWEHRVISQTFVSTFGANRGYSIQALPGGVVLAIADYGLFRSNDRGQTWNLAIAGSTWNRGKHHHLHVSPRDSNHVFVLADKNRLILYEVNNGATKDIPIPAGGGDNSRGTYVRVSKSTAGPNAINIWIGQQSHGARLECADIDCVKNATSTRWTINHRGNGFHDDPGDLAIDGDGFAVMAGTDGGLVKPIAPNDYSMWVQAASNVSGYNSFQMLSLAGTNVIDATGASRLLLYFGTQDNNVWASPDGGVTWPREDCFEGFHIQAPFEVSGNDKPTVVWHSKSCHEPGVSRDNFVTKLNVSSVDVNNASISGLDDPYIVSPNRWLRYRSEGGLGGREVYASTDDLEHWKKIAFVALEELGSIKSAGQAADPVAYGAFKGAQTTATGQPRFGLIRFTNLFDNTVENYDDNSLIYLPNGGSLGGRYVDWATDAVFAVHPSDPNFVIAADVYNSVMVVTHDGGATWTTDQALTDLVLRNGTILMRDDADDRMQVTHIAFDPYNHNRIYIGTRDDGIIASYDRGASWSRIWNTEPIAYMTGMVFGKDGTMYVSTYGRGLWKLQPLYAVTIFILFVDWDLIIPCQTIRCRVTQIDEPRQRRPELIPRIKPIPPWPKLGEAPVSELVTVVGGQVNGLTTSNDQVTGISITPGARIMRYLTPGHPQSDLKVTQSNRSGGWGMYKDVIAKAANRQPISAIALRDGLPIALLTSDKPITEKDLKALEMASSKIKEPSYKPYIIMTTSAAGTRLSVDEDGRISVFGRGFADAQSGPFEVRIDGSAVKDVQVRAQQGGVVRVELVVPPEVVIGEHELVLTQQLRGRVLSARSRFQVPPHD